MTLGWLRRVFGAVTIAVLLLPSAAHAVQRAESSCHETATCRPDHMPGFACCCPAAPFETSDAFNASATDGERDRAAHSGTTTWAMALLAERQSVGDQAGSPPSGRLRSQSAVLRI